MYAKWGLINWFMISYHRVGKKIGWGGKKIGWGLTLMGKWDYKLYETEKRKKERDKEKMSERERENEWERDRNRERKLKSRVEILGRVNLLRARVVNWLKSNIREWERANIIHHSNQKIVQQKLERRRGGGKESDAEREGGRN